MHRPVLAAVVILTLAGQSAHAATLVQMGAPGVAGVNGASGIPGAPGGGGGDAPSVSLTAATGTDSDNAATATGGTGGVGGSGGNGLEGSAGAPAGAGGRGGAATANASTTLAAGSATATARATGGNGGTGGDGSNSAASPSRGVGGPGGDATVTATASNDSGSVTVNGFAFGGRGGFGGVGGAGGSASSESYGWTSGDDHNVKVTAEAQGGSGNSSTGGGLGGVATSSVFGTAIGNSSVTVSSACALAGLIIAIVLLTGLGVKIGDAVLYFSGGRLYLALPLIMLASLVLGMGLPTVVCYILLAVTTAPPIIQMGVSPMAAHMFIFYFGMISMVTPPVGMAFYAGAALAGADTMKTGWTATKIAAVAVVLPYMFVYEPAMLLEGPIGDAILATITALLGATALAAAIVGYIKRPLSWFERLIGITAGLLLVKPGWTTDLIGAGLIVILLLLQRTPKKG